MNSFHQPSGSSEPSPSSPLPTPRPIGESTTETPKLPLSQKSKDGLIRMLLQNATPTPPPPSPSVSMGPPATNLPPIPKWPTSPMTPGGSPGAISSAPLCSPRLATPTITSATAQLSQTSSAIFAVDVTTEDQNPSFIHQISGSVSCISESKANNETSTLQTIITFYVDVEAKPCRMCYVRYHIN